MTQDATMFAERRNGKSAVLSYLTRILLESVTFKHLKNFWFFLKLKVNKKINICVYFVSVIYIADNVPPKLVSVQLEFSTSANISIRDAVAVQ